MPDDMRRELCPGYLYAQAIAHSLIKEFKKTPLTEKERREEKLLAVLDFGRTLLNIAAPIAEAHGFKGAFFDLYQECQDCARPWADASKEHFIEDSKTALVLDVVYEVQRELREVKRAIAKKKKAAVVTPLEGRAA